MTHESTPSLCGPAGTRVNVAVTSHHISSINTAIEAEMFRSYRRSYPINGIRYYTDLQNLTRGLTVDSLRSSIIQTSDFTHIHTLQLPWRALVRVRPSRPIINASFPPLTGPPRGSSTLTSYLIAGP